MRIGSPIDLSYLEKHHKDLHDEVKSLKFLTIPEFMAFFWKTPLYPGYGGVILKNHLIELNGAIHLMGPTMRVFRIVKNLIVGMIVISGPCVGRVFPVVEKN